MALTISQTSQSGSTITAGGTANRQVQATLLVFDTQPDSHNPDQSQPQTTVGPVTANPDRSGNWSAQFDNVPTGVAYRVKASNSEGTVSAPVPYPS
jgi:hypothetical protein